MKLFRQEAIDAKRRRLWGEVRLSHPPGLAVWTGLLTLVCVAVLCLLFFVEFTRRESVGGVISPVGGMIQVVAPRSGVIAAVNVAEGGSVKAGDQLFELADASFSVSGGPVLTSQISQINEQLTAIARRRQALIAGSAAEGKRLQNQLAGFREALASTMASHAIQADVVRIAEQDLTRLAGLAKSGYAPNAEVDRRRRQLLAERAALLSLEQQRDQLKTSISDTQTLLAGLPARLEGELATLVSESGSLTQRLSELEVLRRQSVTASVSGAVSYQNAHPGQVVAAGQPLAVLITGDDVLEAQLFVPTRAAGFLKLGQRARLQVQAFPYQRFGFVEGDVVAIARSASTPPDAFLPGDIKEPVYRVRVRLKSQSVQAYGKARNLAAGMVLKADIETDRRRLWQQLFDPLIAAGRLSTG